MITLAIVGVVLGVSVYGRYRRETRRAARAAEREATLRRLFQHAA